MFEKAVEAITEVYKKVTDKKAVNNAPEGWTLDEYSVYPSGKKGSKPEIHPYLEKTLGEKGKVVIHDDGSTEFINCNKMQKDVFKFQTNKDRIKELAEYLNKRYDIKSTKNKRAS